MDVLLILGGIIAVGIINLPVCLAIETGVVWMNPIDWLQPVIYLAVLLALVKPLGSYMARSTRASGRFSPEYSHPLSV